MKLQHLIWAALAAAALGLTSCENGNGQPKEKEYLVTFEEIALGDEGCWNGSDLQGTPSEQDLYGSKVTVYEGGFSDRLYFGNSYIKDWASWKGFACANHADTITAGVANQYSVAAGEGANRSRQFALAYDNGATIRATGKPFTPRSVMMTNSTYAYLDMKHGSDYTKQFGAGDWFRVTLKGYLNGQETGSADYYPADFRDGKSHLSKHWEKVDLSSLGEVDKITIHFDSSDKSEYGMNTPAYVCMDNFVFTQKTDEVE